MNRPERPPLSQTVAVRFRALDGYELGGLLYEPRGGPAPRQVAVLHPGAAIAQSRYRHFARFVSDAGIPVFTYDYRGIGASRPASLRGFRATMEDWAEYDCAAAIGWLRERFRTSEIAGIAHSISTLLQGGAHNAAEQAQVLMVAPHTGYFADYLPAYRPAMTVMWHAVMPLITRLVGYFPARRLGLGDDIPREIALQWASRRSPDLRPRPGETACGRRSRLLDHCAGLGYRVQVILATDDAFATTASAARVLSYFPGARIVQQQVFTPADAEGRRLGHFGLFRRMSGATLWPRVLAMLGR